MSINSLFMDFWTGLSLWRGGVCFIFFIYVLSDSILFKNMMIYWYATCEKTKYNGNLAYQWSSGLWLSLLNISFHFLMSNFLAPWAIPNVDIIRYLLLINSSKRVNIDMYELPWEFSVASSRSAHVGVTCIWWNNLPKLFWSSISVSLMLLPANLHIVKTPCYIFNY